MRLKHFQGGGCAGLKKNFSEEGVEIFSTEVKIFIQRELRNFYEIGENFGRVGNFQSEEGGLRNFKEGR